MEDKMEQTPQETETQQEQSTKPEPKKAKRPKKNAELEALREERDEYVAALQRERAEFQNFKKRNQTAISAAYGEATGEVVLKILPILDNLERAIEAAKADGNNKSIVEGIELVKKSFIDTLAELEVTEIPAKGEPFDPEVHNAILQEPAGEGEESGHVKDVLQKGYRTPQRVLRHSLVKVAE